MRKTLKIILITLLMVLIIFSILSDLPIGRKLQQGLDLGLYLKLVSLLGLIFAALLAWGYRTGLQSSQKYRRADEVLAKAEEAFERKKKVCDQMESRLAEKYEKKSDGLDNQIEEVRREYQKRLKVLKAQNIELKETVAKLMRTLKQERQQRG